MTPSPTASSGVPGSGTSYALPFLPSPLRASLTLPPSHRQNDGSQKDAARRAAREFAAWPYTWFTNPSVGPAYHSRVRTVRGRITLSDGRPASGAAVFLGDNNPTKTALDQGTTYYYTTYADKRGRFEFADVRTGTYALQAWGNGGVLADVSTSFLQNDVVVAVSKHGGPSPDPDLDLGGFKWALHTGRSRIFQIGDFDRKALGFAHGGAAYQHGLVAQCPANLTYTVGRSKASDWCFGQSALGAWNVEFELKRVPANRTALLTVSLAGYSQGTSASILVNGAGNRVGNLTSGQILSDQCLYRSATTAGEWHLFEFPFDGAAVLRQGWNTLTFNVTASTLWRGFLWDSVVLEWV